MSDYTESRNEEMIRAIIDETPYHTDYTQGRNEQILQSIIDNTPYDKEPESRMEELLIELKQKIEGGGGEIPAELKAAMDAVFNKKFSTSTTYAPDTWADTVNIMGPLPVKTASGAIASFDDGADDVPIVSGIFDIVAQQEGSGDPSPSNPRPINGFTGMNVTRTGPNVWDEEIELGSINSYGELTPSLTTVRCKNPIPVNPNTNYYFLSVSGTSETKFGFVYFYDKNMNFISSWSSEARVYATQITTPNNCYYIRFRMASSYGTTYNNDISINCPATDTTYHAYSGITYNIDWTTEAGTVYGGTLNATTGVLTVDYNIGDLSDLSGSYANGRWTLTGFSDLKNFDARNGDLLAEEWKADTTAALGSEGKIFTEYGNIYCYTSDSSTSPSGLIVYPITTPQTVQLNPIEIRSLLGTNNIWTDTNGDSAIQYRADIDLVLQNL